MRDGHRAVFSREGLATKRAKKRREGASRREMGGRGRQSACAHRVPGCSTATKRPERRAGKRGEEGLQGPSISIRISHFMSPRIAPPNPHLKEQDCEWKTSRPAQGIGAEKQDGDLGFPLHPSMLLPATEVPDPTRDHRPGPTEKHKPSWEETSPGRRAATASRSYIPFEAMSAHAHTGRQPQNSHTTQRRRPED